TARMPGPAVSAIHATTVPRTSAPDTVEIHHVRRPSSIRASRNATAPTKAPTPIVTRAGPEPSNSIDAIAAGMGTIAAAIEIAGSSVPRSTMRRAWHHTDAAPNATRVVPGSTDAAPR